MRRPGIEPGSQEWESCMIPLHQRRRYEVRVPCKILIQITPARCEREVLNNVKSLYGKVSSFTKKLNLFKNFAKIKKIVCVCYRIKPVRLLNKRKRIENLLFC